MIYVVSGYMRCGTSMMMEALQAGGLQAAYSERRDIEMNARWGEPGYVPNSASVRGSSTRTSQPPTSGFPSARSSQPSTPVAIRSRSLMAGGSSGI